MHYQLNFIIQCLLWPKITTAANSVPFVTTQCVSFVASLNFGQQDIFGPIFFKFCHSSL